MSNILINTAYFPPVQYFTKVNNCTEIWIEQYESYGKQSYRNRCDIMTANGVMTLSVPVVKGSSIKILTKDVLVDYSTNWQKLHFKGIESAYKNSPYYFILNFRIQRCKICTKATNSNYNMFVFFRIFFRLP